MRPILFIFFVLNKGKEEKENPISESKTHSSFFLFIETRLQCLWPKVSETLGPANEHVSELRSGFSTQIESCDDCSLG